MTEKANSFPRLFLLAFVALAVVMAVAGVTLAAVESPAESDSEVEAAAPESGRQGGCCGGCRGAGRTGDGGGCGAGRQEKGQGAGGGKGGCRGAGKAGGGGCGGCGKGAGRGSKMGAGAAEGQSSGAIGGAGQGQEGRPRHGAGGGRGMASSDLMATVRSLVHDYRHEIDREIEYLDNGVVTLTRSASNPEAARALERHVLEVKGLLESGGRMRGWDPLFREIFDHADEISMSVETLDDGVRVTETSENPEVAKLIQAHARKVSEFIARGPEAVHEETALPDDYQPSE